LAWTGVVGQEGLMVRAWTRGRVAWVGPVAWVGGWLGSCLGGRVAWSCVGGARVGGAGVRLLLLRG
jgi:hypothetical protein